MKKIIFFIPTLGQGGAERVFVNLANEMVQRHRVSFVIQDSSGVLMDELSPLIETVDIGMENKLKVLRNFLNHIAMFKPDAVISTLSVPNVINVVAHKLSRHTYKVITRQAAPINRSMGYLIKKAHRFAFKNSDIVIANSNLTRNSMLDVLKLAKKSDAIKVIYNPVYDIKMYGLADQDENSSSRLDKSEKYILAVGRLEEVKNFSLLINAYHLTSAKTSLKLVILGEGSQRKLLEELIESLGLTERIVLMGNRSNPYPFYKGASLFISSSKREGFGNIIVEALAFNLPIIYLRSSGAPSEILKGNEYGHEVINNDALSMSKKIDEVFKTDTPITDQLTGRARDFSIEKIALEYEAVCFNS